MCRKPQTNAALLRTFILPFVFRAPGLLMSVSKRSPELAVDSTSQPGIPRSFGPCSQTVAFAVFW